MGNPRHRFKVPADQRCHCGSCAMDLQAHPQDSFSMRIGIPSETKTLEGRVALAPAAAADLVRRGHEVFIQSGAGLKSGFADEAYVKAGVGIVPNAAALYEVGELRIGSAA